MLKRKSLCGAQIQIVVSDVSAETNEKTYDVGTDPFKEVCVKVTTKLTVVCFGFCFSFLKQRTMMNHFINFYYFYVTHILR